MEFTKKDLPKKTEDVADWYQKIIQYAKLADYGPAKGTMIFRPYGYRIWELVQAFMDREIKNRGVENAYFPMLIPESLLKQEKDHLEGFSPELAIVTIGGGEELSERLVLRPTSETIMYQSFAKWIQSWRDLPISINQWSNVVRWEKRTYLFLRTTEFLWQEGHTAHANHEEAWDQVLWAMQMYAQTYQEMMAVPGIIGRKSKSETFPGAEVTLSYESLMPGGKALQSSTSHDLGQTFAKVFNITYQDQDGKNEHVWQTSWGLSTRALGGLILTHGDDQGLIIPPNVAPFQTVIIPVKQTDEVLRFATQINQLLKEAHIRTKLDLTDDESFGYKINNWEMRGVPLRIEIGPKEVEQSQVTLASRVNGKKEVIDVEQIAIQIQTKLADIQAELYQAAWKYMQANTHVVDSYDEFKKILAGPRGFIKSFWCESEACEEKIKAETKATTRCLPLDAVEENGKCIYCGKKAKYRWVFAIAY